MKFFLDTYALIEIARGNPNFMDYLTSDCVTTQQNIAELYYAELLKKEVKNAEEILRFFSKIVVVIQPETIEKAMEFRHRNTKKKFSYIDCFGYTFARENKRLFLTGDKEFKEMEGIEFVR